MRTVNCVKLSDQLEGLDRAPYPGEFGQRIYDHVSKAAWQEWLNRQTMLVNENRLNMLDPNARRYLREQCEAYFFGQGADLPQGYVPRI